MGLPDSKYFQSISNANEKKTEKRFKKLGYSFVKLDIDNNSKKPDYLVFDNLKTPIFLCEVKTINSAGIIHDTNYQASTYDSDWALNGLPCSLPDPLRKIENVLVHARSQYIEYVKANSSHKFLPFVVALFPDFFVECLEMIPCDLFGINEISAVIQIEKDHERKKIVAPMSLSEIINYMNNICKGVLGIPPPSIKWKVLINKTAINKLDNSMFGDHIEI